MPLSPCDIDSNGSTGINDVQRIINQAMGIAAPLSDLLHRGVVDVVDAQIVMNSALLMGCKAN